MADNKIRVLIVDDSPLVRETVRAILASDPAIEVIGIAKDGKEGVAKTFALKPDVITMDLKMPLMSGVEAIEEIMEKQPTPIIVVSGLDIKVIVASLAIGAMDFVAITEDIDQIAKDLKEKIRIASRVRPIRRFRIRKAEEIIRKKAPGMSAEKVIAIGVSTGGPQAMHVLLSKMPVELPAAVLVVQHIVPGFIGGLVEWLSPVSHLTIKLAASGDTLKNSTVFFAPDGYNMKVDEKRRIVLSEDVTKKITHVPSIDIMMKSVAEAYGENTIGVIMTGMGTDGVEGMKAIKKAGGRTISQDENSSIIFGMNKAAIDAGCIDSVIALEKIADEISASL